MDIEIRWGSVFFGVLGAVGGYEIATLLWDWILWGYLLVALLSGMAAYELMKRSMEMSDTV